MLGDQRLVGACQLHEAIGDGSLLGKREQIPVVKGVNDVLTQLVLSVRVVPEPDDNQAQRGTGNVTGRLEWFATEFTDSCQASAALIEESLARARFWSDHQHLDLNERQRKVLNGSWTWVRGGLKGG